MTKAAPKKSEVKKALAEFKGFQDEAKTTLDEYGTLHRFEMAGQCKDLAGNETKVLEIDLDCDGILDLFMDIGPAYSFVPGVEVAPDARVKKDAAKFKRYMQKMANVDLSDSEVTKAVGWSALGQAREVVDGFFMLRLVSDTKLESATES